jgi:hypothetical protein
MTLILSGTDGLSDVDGSAATPAIRGTDANTGIFFPAADTIAFAEGGVESMRIDSSGNVQVGTTTQPSESQVRQTLATSSSTYLQFARTATTVGGALIGTNGQNFVVQTYTGAIGSETYTERMRIDSSGNLLLNTTSALFNGKFFVAVPCNTLNPIALQNTVTQGAGQSFMFMANSAGNKAGSIDHTGTTTVAYTTSSDYRMKENIAPMTGALSAVSQLKPCTYTWKEDGKAGQGFIAHELQAVVPDCVSGEKDAVDADGNPKYQGIDTSFLVATLTAALQELKALVDTQASTITQLQADVAALQAPQGTP